MEFHAFVCSWLFMQHYLFMTTVESSITVLYCKVESYPKSYKKVEDIETSSVSFKH